MQLLKEQMTMSAAALLDARVQTTKRDTLATEPREELLHENDTLPLSPVTPRLLETTFKVKNLECLWKLTTHHFPLIGHHLLCLPFARSPGLQVQPEDKALVGGLSTRVGRLSSGVGILWTSVGTVPTTATPSSRTQGVSKTSTMFERVRRSRFARSFRSLYASSLTLICGIWHLLADKCNGLSAVCQQGEA